MRDPFSLTSHTALVTGGGTGIGLGIARSLQAAGAQVIITGRREAVLRAAAAQYPGLAWRSHDVTDLEANPAFIDQLEADFGPLHILVNNAGTHLKKWSWDTSEAEFARVIETNLTAVFSLTRAAAHHMTRRGSGVILLIGSMTGLFGMSQVAAYGSSKAALQGLMHNLMMEYAPQGVRINGIAPGWIQSPMLEQALAQDPDRRARILQRIPSHAFGTPADIGHTAVFLCAPAGRYLNGVMLPVDGGARHSF